MRKKVISLVLMLLVASLLLSGCALVVKDPVKDAARLILDVNGDTVTKGEFLEKGHVYIARAGMHMKCEERHGRTRIVYSDEPNREGVKPCANYMYETLVDCGYDQVICAVLTGMGADGTEGIAALKKARPNTYVIAQNKETSTVYGMPKNIVSHGLADIEVPLDHVAQEIVHRAGMHG